MRTSLELRTFRYVPKFRDVAAFRPVPTGSSSSLPWTPLTLPVITNNREVEFVSETTGWIGGGPTAGQTVEPVLMKTIDGGQTWDVLSTSYTPRTMFFVDADSA